MKKIALGIMVLLLLAAVAACSASKGGTEIQSDGNYRVTATMTTTTVPQVTTKAASSGIYTGISAGASGGTVADRMIVRTGDISMLVENIPDTMERIKQLTEQYQGYVVSSQSWQSDNRLYGNISIRIPAGDYDTVMKSLGELAVEVTSQTTSSQDVTEEYTDLSAKLKNLEAAEEQLLQIMKQAADVEDVLAVQKELTNTREQIEQTRGRMQYLERTSATSLINISLQTSEMTLKITANKGTIQAGETIYFSAVITGGFTPYSYEWDFGDGSTGTNETGEHQYKTKGTYSITLKVTDDKGNTVTETRKDYITVKSGWDAGRTAQSAWHGLVLFGRVLLNILIWLAIFSPIWLIVGGIVIWQYRRRKKRNQK